MSKSAVTILGAIALALLVLLLVWVVAIKPGQDRQAAREAEVTGAFAGADSRASNAATGAVASLGERNQARDQLDRGTADAINSIPGAALPVDPELHAAARKRNCLRDAYRDHPACVGVH